MLEKFLAAEVLEVRVLHPAIALNFPGRRKALRPSICSGLRPDGHARASIVGLKVVRSARFHRKEQMILSTPAIVGAAIASFLPSHPTTAFVLGFASHFVLDAIPHWDYPIRSAAADPKIGAPWPFDRAPLREAAVLASAWLLVIL